MNAIRGVIVTEPEPDNGRFRFTLTVDATQQRLECLTGSGFVGPVPKAGTKVTVTGECPSDLISGADMPYFVVSEIKP